MRQPFVNVHLQPRLPSGGIFQASQMRPSFIINFMPPNASKELQNLSLAGQNNTAVVVGGTLGIGAAVARLLAKLGCSRIIISGRNEGRATQVMQLLKTLAPDGKIEVDFVKADLSDSRGMRAAASAIQTAVGTAGIAYLVMTQSGVPTGTIEENSDGCDRLFAVQAVSRFALAYLLTIGGALAPNASVMSICNQGQQLDDLSVDDLSLKQRVATHSQTSLFLTQSKRDSVVLDSINEEFSIRYPQYRYYSLWPGLVSSEEFSLSKFPGFLKYVAWVGMKLIGTTPDQYANVPVYILVAPDAEKTLGNGRYFDYKLNSTKIGSWASEKRNREALWDKLTGIIGENQDETM
ncbi:hypothetical protein FB45DRAFT_45064 [Roridomyces roridus]|uniref:NAD(P)-binding protein n=1 Tax=Roridomyces roridus TaxID=1738132 RepID=A0AAD7FK33_9AGAR|nr:hypothetical protein FB45DRAFT_45064 [Roridomyces roridus]